MGGVDVRCSSVIIIMKFGDIDHAWITWQYFDGSRHHGPNSLKTNWIGELAASFWAFDPCRTMPAQELLDNPSQPVIFVDTMRTHSQLKALGCKAFKCSAVLVSKFTKYHQGSQYYRIKMYLEVVL